MKKHIIASILILAVVGCAANGVVQQAIQDAGGGMVWKALAASGIVYSDSASDQAIPCYDGTTGHTIQTTSCYIDDDDHMGVNVASAVGDIAARLHARESGSSIITPTDTVLAVQNNATSATNCYAAFSSGDTGKSILYFGHPTDYDRGGLEYDCATDDMRFFAADDVRLEGDNVTSQAPTGVMYVNSGLKVVRVSKSATYTADSGINKDYVICVTASGVTITLPSASTAGDGRVIVVKSAYTGAGNTTVTATSGNVDGAGSITLGSLRSGEFISDGSNWWSF